MNVTHPNVEILLPFNKIDEYFVTAVKSVLASKEVRTQILLLDDRVDTSAGLPELPIETCRILRTSIRGYGNALSEGVHHLNSEFFALMNADDLIHPRKLITQILDLESRSADLSVGKIVKFNDSGKIITQSLGHLTKGEYTPPVLLLGAYGADASWCGRTEKVKSWKISNDLASDWITAFENFSDLKIIYSPKALYFYRQHDTQMTKTNDYKNFSFDEIYKSWYFMNSRLGYQSLAKDVAKLVAAPWIVSDHSNTDSIKNASAWLREFNFSTHKRYAILVNRRYAFLFFLALRNRRLLVQDLIPATFGVFNYCLETCLNIFRKILLRKFLHAK
jgi:glycosyltransferase involved in cell wall biosynthesis